MTSRASSTNEQKINDRRHEGYVSNPNESFDDPPTLVLDVPVLNVDEIDLEVNDLRANVSLRAELANLVKINVGVDVYLDQVKLLIKGLEAQALLSIKLVKVLSTLDRTLEAIDNNPQILSQIAQDVDSAVVTVSEDSSHSPETDQAGSQLDKTIHETGQTVERAGDESENIKESISNKAETEEATSTLAEEALNEEGNGQDASVPEEADLESQDEDDGEVDATDAAGRKADELGVRLSEVKGTGPAGASS